MGCIGEMAGVERENLWPDKKKKTHNLFKLILFVFSEIVFFNWYFFTYGFYYDIDYK